MTDEQLNEIEVRAQAATKGPWPFTSNPTDFTDLGGFDGVCHFGNSEQYYPSCGSTPDEHDEAFIEHAQVDVVALVTEVRRLRWRIRSFVKAVEGRGFTVANVRPDEPKARLRDESSRPRP